MSGMDWSSLERKLEQAAEEEARRKVTNLGDKKNGGFIKQILSISIQEKLIKIGDG